jgi:hypothetical protein
MEIILPLLACLALGAPLGFAASLLVSSGPELMAGLFGSSPEPGWPRGVQEEDPPGGWTWHLPGPDGQIEASPVPSLEPAEELTNLTGIPVKADAIRPIEIVEGRRAIDRALVLEPITARVRSRGRRPN